MQTLVRIFILGGADSAKLPTAKVLVVNPNTRQQVYIALEQLSQPPFSLRVVQVVQHSQAEWIGLCEPIPSP